LLDAFTRAPRWGEDIAAAPHILGCEPAARSLGRLRAATFFRPSANYQLPSSSGQAETLSHREAKSSQDIQDMLAGDLFVRLPFTVAASLINTKSHASVFSILID
jgi:hypothetical protein